MSFPLSIKLKYRLNWKTAIFAPKGKKKFKKQLHWDRAEVAGNRDTLPIFSLGPQRAHCEQWPQGLPWNVLSPGVMSLSSILSSTLWTVCLAFQNIEKTGQAGPTHPVSHASGSHSIAQIKWLPANQLWKSLWCTLHLFTTLPRLPALVFSPRQLFKNPSGEKKNLLIKCRLCLLQIPASVNWSCIQNAFLGSPVALYEVGMA